MSGDAPDLASPDPDMAAAELALGLLEGDERAAALRRVLAEPHFAQDVERWRGQFGQWFETSREMTPPGGVFARVERSIDRPVGSPVPTRYSRLWPVATAAASAAAAALLAAILLWPAQPAPGPTRVSPAPQAAPAGMLVAAIDPVGAGAPVAAVYDPASGGLRLGAASLADSGRSAELWIIGTDATPHSLGLLRTGGATTLTVAAANRAQIAAGGTLAVSLEATGGSPTGKPQGPIVAKGTLSQV